MSFSRNLSVILVIAVVGGAQFDSGRPFDESKADDIRIGTMAQHEIRESPGPLHTSGPEPLAGMTPDTQTAPMAPMQGVPDPIGGEKYMEYWTLQYTKQDSATVAQHVKG